MKRIVLTCLALSFLASAAAAQSLAELAKQEEARRKAMKAGGKVYTDADLGKVAPAASPAGPAQPAATPEAAKAPGEAQDPAAAAQGQKEPEKDEAWWRGRVTEARAKVERAKVLADAMQSKINALTNDWSARDDPYQREQLAAERTRALGELQRLKDEIGAGTKAIADIEEEARQAGVPPGWLR